jgi:hypothetical protein
LLEQPEGDFRIDHDQVQRDPESPATRRNGLGVGGTGVAVIPGSWPVRGQSQDALALTADQGAIQFFLRQSVRRKGYPLTAGLHDIELRRHAAEDPC